MNAQTNLSKRIAICLTLGLLCCAVETNIRAADPLDEFKIKREAVFEFAKKPTLQKEANGARIRFTTKGNCDVTVAITDHQGRIVRHLASGVLGPNAPAPLRANSLSQEILWDGKDDQGRYIDDFTDISVRVSLGLKPEFERSLYFQPKRRMSYRLSIACPQPEGVYVFYPGPMDVLRMYDHQGNYVKTVFPFPADKVEKVEGLIWHTFPQDGSKLPIKPNFLQNTMLTCGTNSHNLITFSKEKRRYGPAQQGKGFEHYGMYGHGATGLAVRNGRIALGYVHLNRLMTDGSSGGMNFSGPTSSFPIGLNRVHMFPGGTFPIGPQSIAISPDGKTVYTAGYLYNYPWNQDGLHVVGTMSMDQDEPVGVFAGDPTQGKFGSQNGQFHYATSVDVDRQGRVYCSDYWNNRIQIFSPDGTHLKNIQAEKPMQVSLHDKTGQIWVFSYLQGCRALDKLKDQDRLKLAKTFVPQITVLDSFDKPQVVKTLPWPLRMDAKDSRKLAAGKRVRVALNSYTEQPQLWVSGADISFQSRSRSSYQKDSGIKIFELQNDKWVLLRDFMKDAAETSPLLRTDAYFRWRIYTNPKSGKLYVAESDGEANSKAFKELVEIDPETGTAKLVSIPFHAEDMCFDLEGKAYLRTPRVVARFNPKDWSEVLWDYGEERKTVAFGSSSGRKTAEVKSALVIPANSNWHHGGMHVSAAGELVVGCLYAAQLQQRNSYAGLPKANTFKQADFKYAPQMYPGRIVSGKGTFIHIWDKHGELVQEDVVPGLGDCYGVFLDKDRNVYALASATRIVKGKKLFNDLSGTLVKFPSKGAKIYTSSDKAPVPITADRKPQRDPDFAGAIQGSAWAEGAKWFYGGVGFCGKNRGVGCACWNARFVLDYFNRSFAPELDRYSVAVLDSSGNLILRLGTYGNVESNGPDSRVPLAGDGVGLVHGAYLATQTDRRLFISDPANQRICSVKLNYHTTEQLPLLGLSSTGENVNP